MSATIYILIGLPGSGKSTWVKKNAPEGAVIVSSDDLIMEWAVGKGLTYNDAFGQVNFKQIEARMREIFAEAIASGKDIIVDRTNMSPKSRKYWLDEAKGYTKVAVTFILDDVTLNKRLSERSRVEGKSIPPYVVKNMAANYTAATKAEGFTQFIVVRD